MATPIQEIAERAAEAAGLTTAKHAAALGHHLRLMEDARRRTWDGHKAGMRAVGAGEPLPMHGEGDDEMNITITGDIHQQPAPPQPTMQPQQPASKAVTAALAAGMLGLGAGGGMAAMAALDQFRQSPPTVERRDDGGTEQEYEYIEVPYLRFVE